MPFVDPSRLHRAGPAPAGPACPSARYGERRQDVHVRELLEPLEVLGDGLHDADQLVPPRDHRLRVPASEDILWSFRYALATLILFCCRLRSSPASFRGVVLRVPSRAFWSCLMRGRASSLGSSSAFWPRGGPGPTPRRPGTRPAASNRGARRSSPSWSRLNSRFSLCFSWPSSPTFDRCSPRWRSIVPASKSSLICRPCSRRWDRCGP